MRRLTLPAGRRTVLFVSVPTGIGGSTRSLANVLAHVGGRAHRVLAGPPDGKFVRLLHDEAMLDEHLPVISRRWPRPLQRLWSSLRIAAFAVRHRGPSCSARIACTRSTAIGGAASCSLVSVAR